ncbi:hypothetical protein ACI703_15100 [Isoptericola jiangsuensis]|uniref:hypothetical protein n=1 Tax=Isoptericola jiangsuensis TaxID=548579 RepID=UPI00386683CA
MINNPERAHTTSLLRQIATKSSAGQIEWVQSNPSTFQWVKTDPASSLMVSIQRADSASGQKFVIQTGNRNSDYLFQIQDLNSKRVVVMLSSKERPDMLEALAEMYRSAERGIDQQNNRYLSRLL